MRDGDIPGVQLRCRETISRPLDEVWPWLQELDRLSRWLGPVEEAPGGELNVHRAGSTEIWRTEGLVAPRRWIVRLHEPGWRTATRVTLELTPAAGACELSVLQEEFHQLDLSACLTVWEAYRQRWRESIARLKASVESATR